MADLACEEARSDSASLRRFAGIDLGRKPVPDATSLLRFRYLLEQHQLSEKLFAAAGRVLQDSGMTLKIGMIVDATIMPRPVLQRTLTANAIPRCTRRAKQGSSTSA